MHRKCIILVGFTLELLAVQDVFHISMLKKYIPDPSHVVNHQSIKLQSSLSYEEVLVKIINKKFQAHRNKVIPLVEVRWCNH